MNYFLWRLFNFFFVVVWINFSCVPQIIFFVYCELFLIQVLRIIFSLCCNLVPRAFPLKNGWDHPFFKGKALETRLIVLIIIFHDIVNLFLGLQCFAGLAVEADWFESLTSLGDHFENFEVEECFQRECQGETFTGKERKEVFIFLTKSVRSQLSVR